MIKFFRKIRQNLLTENKFSKYLLYAIGEIILVVIGILIALAINDWNNEKRIQSEETATLQKLIQDLKSDNKRYLENIEIYKKQDVYLTNAKIIIFKKSLSDNEIKEVMNYYGAYIRDINPRKTTYEEMLNSGRIYALSNEKLVDDIIEYYQFLDKSIYQNQESRREFRAVFYGPGLTDFWFWKVDEEPFDYAKVFFSDTDSPAYRVLKQSAGWSASTNKQMLENNKELLKTSNDLIKYIEIELKSK
ncbi:hypothetical protein ATE92_0100 [Ulvibacter sp. MAR_2010_11]|uniref:DUF6090 family protein n=1 Tax=Ulvibacter sp. MAR_2010_11 TaxID=1250229 RepID=UPI000C2C0EB3|nr:DUF6090 family protein [Ulvibacter sp. MAR_2010_11]PKA81977.1 hypothetical protein ATE92_0100 [Ulvibacter sp. MAR_2010_11]